MNGRIGEFDKKRTWGPTPCYPGVVTWCDTHKPKGMIIVAGPCSIENEEQIARIVPVLADNGVTYARGGVYRAGTYPRHEFGLQEKLAKMWSGACRRARLKAVMEVLDIRQIGKMERFADAFQVGARHMQDYALLKELAKTGKPVFLKRSQGATLDEFLGAAEYLVQDHAEVVLVERGGSTFHNHVRWDLSISLIAAVKCMTAIPILVDASHGTGRRDLVRPMTLAGIAAGADGFLVEVHPDPCKSLSDADQAYPLNGLEDLIVSAKAVKACL